MKRFILLIAGGAALIIHGVPAAAYTAQDILNGSKNEAWLSLLWDFEYADGQLSKAPELVSGSHTIAQMTSATANIRFSNLIPEGFCNTNPQLDFPVQIAQSGTATVANGLNRYDFKITWNGRQFYSYPLYLLALDDPANNHWGIIPVNSAGTDYSNSFQGTVTRNAEGNYEITFSKFALVNVWLGQSTAQGYYFYVKNEYWFGGFTFTTYTPNARITETDTIYADNGNEIETFADSYNVRVTVDGTEITVDNFGNIGRPYYLGNGFVPEWDIFDGIIDTEELEVALWPKFVGFSHGIRDDQYIWDCVAASSYDISTDEAEAIEGVIKGSFSHREDGRIIVAEPKVEFSDFHTYQLLGSTIHTISKVSDCIMTLPMDKIELDHDVGLQVDEFRHGRKEYGSDDRYFYIGGSYRMLKPCAVVDCYTLYLLPGTHESFESVGNDGVCVSLDEYVTDIVPWGCGIPLKAVVDEDDAESQPFAFLVPENILISESGMDPKTQPFSAYIVAGYKDFTSLAETRHSILPIGTASRTILTGVVEIFNNPENSDSAIYTLQGIPVLSPVSGEIYIMVCNGLATKMIKR